MIRSMCVAGFAVLVLAGCDVSDMTNTDAVEETALSASIEAHGDVATVERFAQLALDCVHREYPNKISHVLQSADDVRAPRELTPAFYGCFDWHSSVHGHWLLARLLRLYPDADFAADAEAALNQSLTPENIAAEVAYFTGEGRASFERPYGMAWLLQLGAELREQGDSPQAQAWLAALAPLEDAVVAEFKGWLPRLAYPIRLGTHNQSAFAFGLALDWARVAGDAELEGLLVNASRRFHLNDTDCPLAYEPSGEDFLSPCLMEADLMRRVLDEAEFASWLSGFLPDLPTDGAGDWLEPGVVLDPTDGKLVHLDGVNLSRAWALEGMASGLAANDPRVPALRAAAARHAQTGLASVSGQNYEGGHWLASFATYLVTKRGVAQ